MSMLNLIGVREVAKELGLTLQTTYNRLYSLGIEVIQRPFGPGTKGYIERREMAKIRYPIKQGRRKKIKAKPNGI